MSIWREKSDIYIKMLIFSFLSGGIRHRVYLLACLSVLLKCPMISTYRL